MAAPLTPDQLISALRLEGLSVVEIPGWRDRCRCHLGSHSAGGRLVRGWGPITGVTWHITTGAANSGQAAIDYCGYLNIGRPQAVPPTPGPLVQITIDADGRALICSAGRSNHVGSIGQSAFDHMLAADFSLTSYQNVRGEGIDGNTHCYGIEIQTPTTPSQTQINAAVKVSAAICRAYGWTGQEVHGHGEVAAARSYSDPNLNMGDVRRAVMAQVASPAGSGSTPTQEGNTKMAFFMKSTPQEGGKHYVVAEGAQPHELTPDEWSFFVRLGVPEPTGNMTFYVDQMRQIANTMTAPAPIVSASGVDMKVLTDATSAAVAAALVNYPKAVTDVVNAALVDLPKRIVTEVVASVHLTA